MDIQFPKSKDIIVGTVDYYLDDLARDLRAYTEDMLQNSEHKIKAREVYGTLLLITMMSSEEKPEEEIVRVFKCDKKMVTLAQEMMEEFIEVARAIHMRMFLDILEKYRTSTSITLSLVNMEISKFMRKQLKPENEHNV